MSEKIFELIHYISSNDEKFILHNTEKIDEILNRPDETLFPSSILRALEDLFEVLIRRDYWTLLEYLLKKRVFDSFDPIQIDTTDSQGNTALSLAIRDGQFDLAKLLIEKGADVTKENYRDHIAPIHRLLGEQGADFTSENDKHHIAPIHSKIIASNEKLLKDILNQNPKLIYFHDEQGKNLLHIAANGKDNLIEILLKEGVDPLEPNNLGHLPIDITKIRGIYLACKMLKQAGLNKKSKYAEYIKQTAAIRLEGGHPLGLAFKYEMTNPVTNKLVRIESEGSNSHATLDKLKEFLEDYLKNKLKKGELESRVKQHFEQVDEALKTASDFSNLESVDAKDNLIKRANDSTKLTVIPTRSSDHSIGVARFGDLLLITNRGFGKLRAGTTIFKLKPDVKFDRNLVDFLSYGTHSLQDIQNKLLELVDDNYIGIPLPVKDQKFGTCSFVNPKSNIEAALFAQRFYELSKEERDAIFEGMKRNHLEKQKYESDNILKKRQFEEQDQDTILERLEKNSNFVKIKKYAEENYKDFTKFIRDSNIDNIIRKYHQAEKESQPELAAIYQRILAEYIIAHPGNPKLGKSRGKIPKSIGDLQRIKKILLSFDDPARLELFMQFTEELLIKSKPYRLTGIFETIENNAKLFNIPSLVKINYLELKRNKDQDAKAKEDQDAKVKEGQDARAKTIETEGKAIKERVERKNKALLEELDRQIKAHLENISRLLSNPPKNKREAEEQDSLRTAIINDLHEIPNKIRYNFDSFFDPYYNFLGRLFPNRFTTQSAEYEKAEYEMAEKEYKLWTSNAQDSFTPIVEMAKTNISKLAKDRLLYGLENYSHSHQLSNKTTVQIVSKVAEYRKLEEEHASRDPETFRIRAKLELESEAIPVGTLYILPTLKGPEQYEIAVKTLSGVSYFDLTFGGFYSLEITNDIKLAENVKQAISYYDGRDPKGYIRSLLNNFLLKLEASQKIPLSAAEPSTVTYAYGAALGKEASKVPSEAADDSSRPKTPRPSSRSRGDKE